MTHVRLCVDADSRGVMAARAASYTWQREGINSVTITQKDLESRLWDAANALRGPVDPADFKTYVFPMLFWKWISDTWAYEHDTAFDEYGDDLDEEIEADFHRFEMPKGTTWSETTTKIKNLGAEVSKAFQRIEKANPRSLAGVFGDASWSNKERLPESALLDLINAFNKIKLNPTTVSHDLLGAGYEYLLKNFADESGKKAGEFFTPREVVSLLVGILRPEAGESVYDPTCGSGGMLVETINQLRVTGKDHRTLRVYGQEINLTTASIARMNLFLHEIEDFEIKRGDTLRVPAFKNPSGTMRTFDVVIANPPFSLANWGAERWVTDPRARFGNPPSKNGDFAFIQHMLASMAPESGRVGVVMPHGALVRTGIEASIRQQLVEADLLEAVIGLPPNLFYSTDIPTCILVFRARKPVTRVGNVLFIDGSARYEKAVNRNSMRVADVNALIEAYRTGAAPVDEDRVDVRLVPVTEIAGRDYDLRLGHYMTVAAEEAADLGSALMAYADTRIRRMSAEADMFRRLRAAEIDMSAVGVSND